MKNNQNDTGKTKAQAINAIFKSPFLTIGTQNSTNYSILDNSTHFGAWKTPYLRRIAKISNFPKI